ncbi:hypothetical protein BCR43DRAFT_512040 [Syncephalastrum racemosum]|uniref:F-box domain-containing protein n=1 Tax=Syncephalastrum racemosum TaxID=13706 RepID=A0A1X2HP51_SYNRA|nr:hypothetical protein BCR43DRAFT_512040 [Syncephalastrum racemosum]
MSLDFSTLEVLLQEVLEASRENDFERYQSRVHTIRILGYQQQIQRHMESKAYNGAISTAYELIAEEPYWLAGYQWAGDSLCELCRYKDAVEIYQEGIYTTQVPDKTITEHYEAAVAKLEIKIDPIERLPAEVICRIFDFVPQKRILCSMLSSAWRRTLFRSLSWKSIKWNQKNPKAEGTHEDLSEGYWWEDLANVIRDKTTKLSVQVHAACPLTYLLETVFGVECYYKKTQEYTKVGNHHLGKLRLYDITTHALLPPGRPTLGFILTSLVLTIRVKPSPGFFKALISLLPKLVILEVESKYKASQHLVSDKDFEADPAIVSDIEELTWPTCEDFVQEPAMVLRCPKLKKFQAYFHEETKSIDTSTLCATLIRNCPDLLDLIIQHKTKRYTSLLEDTTFGFRVLLSKTAPFKPGLRTFYLDPPATISSQTAAEIISSNLVTLREIHVQEHRAALQVQKMLVDSEILWPLMDEVSWIALCIDCEQDSSRIACDILRRCQLADTVRLGPVFTMDVGTVLSTLSCAKNLQIFLDGNEESILAYKHYLGVLQSQGKASPVKNIYLGAVNLPSGRRFEDIATSIASLPALNFIQLVVHFYRDQTVSAHAMRAFLATAELSGLSKSLTGFSMYVHARPASSKDAQQVAAWDSIQNDMRQKFPKLTKLSITR